MNTASDVRGRCEVIAKLLRTGKQGLFTRLKVDAVQGMKIANFNC